jgi:hypothetical protein
LPRTLAELRVRFPDSVCITDTTSDGEATLPVDPSLDAALGEPQPAINAWPRLAKITRSDPVHVRLDGHAGSAPEDRRAYQMARARVRSIADPPPTSQSSALCRRSTCSGWKQRSCYRCNRQRRW